MELHSKVSKSESMQIKDKREIHSIVNSQCGISLHNITSLRRQGALELTPSTQYEFYQIELGSDAVLMTQELLQTTVPPTHIQACR